MSLTRWKLLAGIFGLALCGLAALAEPACRKLTTARRLPEDPQPKTGAIPARPIEVALPKPIEMKPVPLVSPAPIAIPKTPDLPSITPVVVPPVAVAPVPLPVPVPVITAPIVKPIEVAKPPEVKLPEVTGTIITPEQFADQFAKEFGKPVATPAPAEPSKIAEERVFELPVPMQPVKALPPIPAPIVEPVFKPSQPRETEPRVATVIPVPQPELAPPIVEVAPHKKLIVTLKMGDGYPKFDVRDGDDIVLKVISEGVEVKAPSERGESISVLKATRKVRFITPGGEGFCDELQVVPGTGEVIASGRVMFKYTWGKVETAVTSEKMTFRLGTGGPMSLSDITTESRVK